MKKGMWMLCGLAVWVLATVPALAEGDKPAGRDANAVKEKPKSELQGEYAIMANELGLSPDQVTKLTDRVKAQKEAMSNWQKENGPKMEEAQKALKAAKEAKDEAATKKAGDEVKALNESKAKLDTEMKKDVDAILTPEQKTKWDGFNAYRRITQQFAKAKLTDEQKGKIRPLAEATAKDTAGKEEKDRKAAWTELTKKVEEMLSPEQVEAMKKVETRPAREPAKEKPANPAPGASK